ncbi:MAG: hypothetical protein WCJ04_06465 [Actinomycetes bacterium]
MSDESDFLGGNHDRGANGSAQEIAPEQIVCVDCGGVCHLLTRAFLEEDGTHGFQPGDIVAYRCEDCLDRWDIELE